MAVAAAMKMVRRLRWSQWFGDDDGSGSGCHGEDGGGGLRVGESGMVDLIDRETGIVFGFAGNARLKIFPTTTAVVASVRPEKSKGRVVIKNLKNCRMSQFGHVKRRPQTAPVRRMKAMLVEGSRRRGRPKLRWEDRLKQDMKELRLSEDMISDRIA
nr:polyprotein, putative [Tanacetum cinerariifolium]